jgi:hypothetical protein
MDAGLAAVLGAAVGTIGTGGAAAITSLVNRSQSRMQLEAEHKRILLEPRRNTYIAFTEHFKKVHDALEDLQIHIASLVDIEADFGDERIREFWSMYAKVQEMIPTLDHLRAATYIEGPSAVTGACIDACNAMQESKSNTREVINELSSGNVSTELADSLQEEHMKAYDLYLRFLYTASDAAGARLLGLKD